MAKAVIFDLDGVVIDTERSVWLNSSAELISLYGKKHLEDQVGHLMYGAKFEDATTVLYKYYKIDDDFESFLEKRRQLVRKGFAESVVLMEGFEDFYKRLNGLKMAIATSMDCEFLELTLNHIPLKTLFNNHVYTIKESGGRGKPHPDIFLYTAKKIGESPENCIVIEDAPKGVEAAKAAYMRVIGLAKSVSSDKLLHADYVVDSFTDITEEMLS